MHTYILTFHQVLQIINDIVINTGSCKVKKIHYKKNSLYLLLDCNLTASTYWVLALQQIQGYFYNTTLTLSILVDEWQKNVGQTL